MKPPCIIIVKHILPAIRVLVMKELIEKYSMRKIDVSARMDLTPAAITQYLKGERGTTFIEEISKSEETMKKISKLAEALVTGNVPADSMIEQLCTICAAIRSGEMLCALHQKDLPALEACKCTICGHSA